MKKISFLLKFSSLISILIFLLLIIILNFILVPKTFNTISQVSCLEDENICSILISINKEQKNKINNQVINIYFIEKHEYKNTLANNWLDDQLIILETHDFKSYINQKVLVTYNYESLLSYILNNIS